MSHTQAVIQSLDFIVELPKSNGYDAVLVLVMVDRLNEYGHLIPFKHPYLARSIVEVFVKKVVKLLGISSSIVIVEVFVG